MHVAEPTPAAARHELVLGTAALLALAVPAGPAGAPLVAALVPLVVLVAGAGALGGGRGSRPLVPLLLPAVLAGGAAGVIQVVPAGLGTLLALAALAAALDRVVALEVEIRAQPGGVSEGERARILVAAVATAFVGFAGVAALVPGGMPEPSVGQAAGSSSMGGGWLAALAAADAAVALAVGWRLSALHVGRLPDVARSALTYALVTAITAGLVRAIDLPRLVGPAILTLVFYLWDAQHGSAPARRREHRFVWELVLLGIVALVVIAWNTRIAG